MSLKTSESIKNLSKALLVAQAQMGAAKKDAKNPFFKSTYADLPTVMEVVKLPLNEAGIVVLQPSSHHDGKNFITTTLIHSETGEWMQSETEVVSAKANDPQAFGAAQTYARRFGLQAMLFIPAEDDDGNTASGRVAPTVTAKSYQTNNAVTGPTVTLELKNNVNPNAEFDAIAKPVATTTTAPATKSSFRKNKPAVASATKAETPTTTTSDDWS
jgi:hypothetical protein